MGSRRHGLVVVSAALAATAAFGGEPRQQSSPTREQCEVATIIVRRLVAPPLVFNTRPVNYGYPTSAPPQRLGLDPTLPRRFMQQPKRSAYECGSVVQYLRQRGVQARRDAPAGVETISIGLPTLNISNNQAAVLIHREVGGRFGGDLEAVYFFELDDHGAWKSIDPPSLLRQSN